MEIMDIIKSITYLDFINQLDNLVYELLYSSNGGYTTLKSIDAVKSYESILEKFDNESYKIASNITVFDGINDVDDIIFNKKINLIDQIRKHHTNEVLVWADEVYQNLIDNSLLSVSLNKDHINLDEIYNRALCAISWICNIKGFDDSEKEAMIKKFDTDFKGAINSIDSDVLNSKTIENSDAKTFLKLWDLIVKDDTKFLETDVQKYTNKLTVGDINYFYNLKNQLKTFKKTSIIDEIYMINTALSVLKINSDNEKYGFIKQVLDDFNCFISQNKLIEEDDKIEIIKRRINLFSDIYSKKPNSKYYKFIFSNE